MNSSGLLELHYDTMRKRQKERAKAPAFIHGPTNDRMFSAAANYGGAIPGKEACNIVGCSWQQGSKIAHEVRGRHFDPPMSGVTYTLSGCGLSRGMNGSASLPSINGNGSASQMDLGASTGSSNPWLNRSSEGKKPPKLSF